MKWISVEDRLPDNSIEYNCHHNGQVFSAFFDAHNNKWYVPSIGSDRVAYYIEVSHWMPLPEPPDE